MMDILHRIKDIKNRLVQSRWSKRVLIMLLLILLLLVFVDTLRVKDVNYSYEHDTCISNLVFLPDLQKKSKENTRFSYKQYQYVGIAGFNLLSLKTCFTAKSTPSAGFDYISVSLFGNNILNSTYKLLVSELPTVRAESIPELISISKMIEINLNSSDIIFDYQLEINDKKTKCQINESKLLCDISSLGLMQGKQYDLKILRLFNNKVVSTIAQKKIDTLDPISVVNTSITSGQIIYDSPKSFTIEFDKDVQSSQIILEKVSNQVRTNIDIDQEILGKQITLSVNSNLDRDSSYEFTINDAIATDSSTLDDIYKLPFKISDGPSVSSVNVDNISLPISKTIVITLDQDITSDQNISDFVNVTGVNAIVASDKKQIRISYSNVSLCTDINITVRSGLVSEYGIIQNDWWSFNTRTICHTTSTIGYSKEGRQILAYTFGSGAKSILFIGAIHGNEVSSKYLMNEWVNELERNAHNIPTDKRLIIIPVLNPDGVAAYRRANSSGVDLNRNFPTLDWQTDIYSINNQPIPGGGGSVPLSEPESQIIADYTSQISPRLTVTFHSAAGYAIANQASDSASLAASYSRLSGYRNMTGVDGAFSYPITGTYDDWVREELNVAGVLIELSSNTNSEFSKNKAALWAMAKS